MPPAEPAAQDAPESPGPDEPDPGPDAERPPLVIDLVLHAEEPDPPITGWIEPMLGRAAELVGLQHATLTVVVVQDAEMAELHERYTGVAGTTDVLTFDLLDPPNDPDDEQAVEGDIVVCLDEAVRQAQARRHPVRHELLLYAVHGLMHLMGEDDHDHAAYLRMHAREDSLLEQLGVGRLFDANPQPPDANP
ncbi:MAG: rRNA maturation RNase YbeY [Phycisphaeraceae bacterium]